MYFPNSQFPEYINAPSISLMSALSREVKTRCRITAGLVLSISSTGKVFEKVFLLNETSFEEQDITSPFALDEVGETYTVSPALSILQEYEKSPVLTTAETLKSTLITGVYFSALHPEKRSKARIIGITFFN